ncbi:hypothetical protein ETB91_02980 [Lacticaseibacillus rhamnosus]|nr:hypothetical protein [Lacticaseibacillus rhamnosus]RXS55345.1 hypothetical protein ETB91_02980 [Lacticaseibacillus rhamnosus]TLQ25296.1 hypothetical protein FEZ43_06375 [Lacticaseibacillus rhamnosus]
MFVDGAAEIDWRWLTLTLTRSPAQKPAHKDPGRNDQTRVITPKAAYAPVSNRAGSRSLFKRRFLWNIFHHPKMTALKRPRN